MDKGVGKNQRVSSGTFKTGKRYLTPFPQRKGNTGPPHTKSNNLAEIAIDMRHVARYGTGDDTDNPPQGTETALRA